jgi:hypothetical protein
MNLYSFIYNGIYGLAVICRKIKICQLVNNLETKKRNVTNYGRENSVELRAKQILL